jgi:hypothetical protein
VLEGKLEPSDRLIDFVYSLYEENRRSSKDAEVAGPSTSSKQDANSEEEKLKDVSGSDNRIRCAFQRRSLSFDQVTIATYRVMEEGHDCMFEHRKREALPGYGQVKLQQLEAADKALFQEASRVCRDGIVPKSDGTQMCSSTSSLIWLPRTRTGRPTTMTRSRRWKRRWRSPAE